MTWTEFDPVGEKGAEIRFESAHFTARLVLDCHREPRKLEISFRGPAPACLINHLHVFAEAVVISEDELTLIDREGYFRLFVVPGGLRVTLRKAAPPAVVAELLCQVERACAPRACNTCVTACVPGALSLTESLFRVDSQKCNHCLDCVRHHAVSSFLPPPPVDTL